jgi:hypothetical protein
MEYRGSKSENISVKEQRVDGHRYVNITYLRYTLMGFERNYQIRIPSNHIITYSKYYITLAINQIYNLSDSFNPLFLTGFFYGEYNLSIKTVKST